MVSIGVETYLAELEAVIAELPREPIIEVVDLLMDAWWRGARLFIIGNGGSAATASHMANDLNKLTIVPGEKRFCALALTDNVPLITAWANDSAFSKAFAEQLKHFVQPDDVLISITTSGNSPNVVCAMEYAKEIGATNVLFGGSTGGRCAGLADYTILTPTEHQGIQEDCHLIFNHVIANTIKAELQMRYPKIAFAAD